MSAVEIMFGMFRYDRADGPGPTQNASSARRTCSAARSASLKIATVATPSSRHARIMRSAISPRLATSTFLNTRTVYCKQRRAVVHSLAFFDVDHGNTSGPARANRIPYAKRLDECKLAVAIDRGAKDDRRPQKADPSDYI